MAEKDSNFNTQAAISETIGLAVSLVSSSQQAKKQRELQKDLAKLSLEQQEELAKRLQDTQSNVEKTRIMYQTFALLEAGKLSTDTKNKQITLYYFLGGGAMLLVAMAIIYKMRK